MRLRPTSVKQEPVGALQVNDHLPLGHDKSDQLLVLEVLVKRLELERDVPDNRRQTSVIQAGKDQMDAKDAPDRLVLFFSQISRSQEPLLAQAQPPLLQPSFDNRVASLLGPLLRDPRDVQTGRFANGRPEVERRRIAVRVRAEVDRHALEENVLPDLEAEQRPKCQSSNEREEAEEGGRTMLAIMHRTDEPFW
jgi:hypothetical protein